MFQWAEIRQLHLVEGVPKKEVARRLKLDVKTVRRAIGRSTPPVRVSPARLGTLDPWRERIKQWLCEEPRLTAKRIRRLLLPVAGPVPARTVRRSARRCGMPGTSIRRTARRGCWSGWRGHWSGTTRAPRSALPGADWVRAAGSGADSVYDTGSSTWPARVTEKPFCHGLLGY